LLFQVRRQQDDPGDAAEVAPPGEKLHSKPTKVIIQVIKTGVSSGKLEASVLKKILI